MRSEGKWDGKFIAELAGWLGTDGLKFFGDILDKYKTLNVVLPGKPPHPVHMREGMQVRNHMRHLHTEMGHPYEDAHWYDNHWMAAVKECLGIETKCIDCDDTGYTWQLVEGSYKKVNCPACKGG